LYTKRSDNLETKHKIGEERGEREERITTREERGEERK